MSQGATQSHLKVAAKPARQASDSALFDSLAFVSWFYRI